MVSENGTSKSSLHLHTVIGGAGPCRSKFSISGAGLVPGAYPRCQPLTVPGPTSLVGAKSRWTWEAPRGDLTQTAWFFYLKGHFHE